MFCVFIIANCLALCLLIILSYFILTVALKHKWEVDNEAGFIHPASQGNHQYH